MNWRPRLGRILRRHSLRQRYLSAAVFLGCGVVHAQDWAHDHQLQDISARLIDKLGGLERRTAPSRCQRQASRPGWTAAITRHSIDTPSAPDPTGPAFNLAGFSAQFRQQLLQHTQRLPLVTTAEQIQVIEDVIEVVELLA
jgi:hypothetical protein